MMIHHAQMAAPHWLSAAICNLKAHTHSPIFRVIIAESTVETADSITESADSTTNFTKVGLLSISNMFNISTRTKSADYSRPIIAIARLQIGLVGMGLYSYPPPHPPLQVMFNGRLTYRNLAKKSCNHADVVL